MPINPVHPLRRPAAARTTLRVLDITKFYAPGGGGVRTYLDAKIADFRTRDVRHTLVIPGPARRRTQRGNTTVYRIPGQSIPFTPGYRLLLSARSLREIIKRERPHVIEVGSPFFVPLVTRWASQGMGIPIVGFYHADLVRTYVDPYTRRLPPRFRDGLRRVTRAYVRRVFSRFDRTIAAPPAVGRELSGFGVPNVRVIPLGVDLDLFHPAHRSEALRTRLRVPPEIPIALFAGRLCPEKGLEVLLAAQARMPAGGRPHLLLVGEGPSASRLQEEARQRPDLTVLPFVSNKRELAAIYASVDLYLAPGPGETFGLAVAEAMASGNPVVGVDSGAVPDRVAGSGVGELYLPDDPESLAVALLRMMPRLGPEMRAAARDHATREFRWRRTFDALVDLYSGLVPEGTRV